MTSIDLRSKWLSISDKTPSNGYRSIRITSDCISELYLGVNSESKRCLILSLPPSLRLSFTEIQKQNLSIAYFSEKNYLVLQLNDADFFDLFDDLVISLYQGIKDLSVPDEYSKYFIESFYRWNDFFEDKKVDLLSEEVIKGLFGELIVLKTLIEETNSLSINEILESWKGPYDKANDFEFETRHIEVKSKSPTEGTIKISSEYQLEQTLGKEILLKVITLANDFSGGKSIADLIKIIKPLVHARTGDVSIIWRGLSQKSILPSNIIKYDVYKFTPVSCTTYDCSPLDFPKLVRSNIATPIHAIRYNLSLNLLSNYIIEERKL